MKVGTHSFSRVPHELWAPNFTFSVGVFQWTPTKNGKGIKKGPAKVRVKGLCGNPEPVYVKAREIADALDAETYAGPKTVTAS